MCWQRSQPAGQPLLQGEQPPAQEGSLQSPQHNHQPTCTIFWGLLGTCEPFPPLMSPLGEQPHGSGAGEPWDRMAWHGMAYPLEPAPAPHLSSMPCPQGPQAAPTLLLVHPHC